MGDKKHVAGNKMSVTDFSDPLFAGKSASKMAKDLLAKYHNGPGDTIETAAYRVQKQYGVDASIVMQGWNREPRGMLAHRWLPLFQAWCAAGFAKADAAYDAERQLHEDTSALARLADFVAGKKAQPQAVTTPTQQGE
jgi:hypothetical protein